MLQVSEPLEISDSYTKLTLMLNEQLTEQGLYVGGF